MRALDRLERDALDGDLDAAAQWLAEARRRHADLDAELRTLMARAIEQGDGPALATIVAALGAFEAVAEQLDAMWTTRTRAARLEQVGHGLGLVLDRPTRDALDACVARANHRARVRRVTRTQVLHVLLRARLGGLGIACDAVEGGSLFAASGVVMAVVLDDAVVVGAGRGKGEPPTPGRVWRDVQPWQRDLTRNLDKARTWAAVEADDRVRVARVELAATAAEAVERRAIEVHDPLSKLLDGEPSRGSFGKLVSAVNKQHKKDPDAAEHLLQHVARVVDTWPDDVRVGGLSWLTSLTVDARTNVRRPGWQLIRHLELASDANPQQLDALHRCPATDGVRLLTLGPLSRAAAETLVGGHDWPALRRITLTPGRKSRVVSALAAARPATLARVTHVDIDGYTECAFQPPRAVWHAAADDAIELRFVEVDRELVTPTWGHAFAALCSAVPPLRSLRLYNGHWPRLLEHLDVVGCMGDPHQLTLEGCSAARQTALAAMVSPALQGLVLDLGRQHAATWLAPFVKREVLAGVRRLSMRGILTAACANVLAGKPLVQGLETLCLEDVDGAFDATAWIPFFEDPAMGGLRVLGVGPVLPDGLARWLGDPQHLPALERIELVGNDDRETVESLLGGRPGIELTRMEFR